MSLNKDDLITILGQYLGLLPSRWQGIQTYIAIYITLVSGIFSVLISNIKIATDVLSSLPLYFGCVLVFILAQFAKITIKKQNKHVKELLVLIAKLELEIGLYTHLPKGKIGENKLWEEDDFFLTPKWVTNRLNSGTSSKKFIDKFQGSSAKFAYYIFTSFQIFSVLLAILILIISLNK